MMKKSSPKALYVHIPFCNYICSYCSFAKQIYNQELVNKYVDNLLLDLNSFKGRKFNSIYLGGGTPLALDNFNLDRLLNVLKDYLNDNYEFTIEGNIENINAEKVDILIKNKINRVSIGVQTFNENLLKLLNRKHSYQDVLKAYELLKKKGLDNLNFDFIYGLPNQTSIDLINDLKILENFDVNHLSFYSLTIDEHTLLYNKNYQEKDEDVLRDYADIIYDNLLKRGYEKYEVSNFAKNKAYSIHNLTYWNNEEYEAIGIGASGYKNRVRFTNLLNLNKYLDGKREKDEVVINDYDYEYEFIMLSLRTIFGIDLNKYQKIYKKDFLVEYQKELKELLKLDLIEVNEERVKVKGNNFMILDSIILKFIERLDKNYGIN